MSLNSTARDAGETLSHDMLNGLREDILQEAGEHVVATGSSNAFVLTIDPNVDGGDNANEITSCPAGFRVKFKANHTPSGVGTTTPTLLVQKSGPTTIQAAADIVRADGTALADLEILINQEIEAVFDGTKWRIVSQLSTQLSNFRLATDETFSLNNGTTADQTLISFTLPGGLLGTENELVIEGFIDSATVSTNRSLSIKLKYGSTTVATAGISYLSTASPYFGFFRASLIGTGATNTQRGTVLHQYFEQGGVVNAITGTSVNSGTSAEDSTGDLTVSLTASISITANINWTTKNIVAKLIRG